MRLAILGGSFNPMHLGHLFLADTVLSALHYDRVVLVPAYKSPFKLAAAGMEDSARDRLEMIAASIAGDPRLTVDPCEIRRGGVSYTVNTVADIIRRYAPDGKPGLIIGDDLAADFPEWHKSAEVLAMADIIIARRTSVSATPVPYPCTQITNDVMEVSSAMIREKIAAGGAWRYLVPPAVRSIIEERGMYGFADQTAENEPPHSTATHNLILRVEEAVRESNSLERFLHSRNTALMSWDLCRRLSSRPGSPDPQMGYLAGIAHDMAKSLSDKELHKLAKSDGRKISRLEKGKPSLLHGRASAVLLKERFNVHNEAVLEAAAMHTLAGKNMGPLAKIVYIADKMEVSREKVDPAARKIVYGSNDLDRIFVMALDQTVSWLHAKKLKLPEETLNLLEKMRRASG
jgi:nicotinate-nucleotide adenylyltransferase